MTAITPSVDLDRRGRIAVLTINNPPVNALSQHLRQGLRDGVTQAIADAAVGAIVITCAGRTFIAGADITEFGKPPREPGLHEVLDLIESSPKPVVAAVHGTALGGGLEVALACHYRVGVRTARFGLPEVKLGLLPGAGGTQRLPRVVGVEKALQMIVSGDPIGADAALNHGLIDAIVDGDLTAAGVAFAEKILSERRPLKKIRDLEDALAAAVGAGTMGGGIAMTFANVGIPVTVVEISREPLERGLAVVRKNYEATASKGRLTAADVDKRMGLIRGTTDFGAIADADIVIEAVFEEMAVKKDVFAKLDKICKADAVLATNTSTLDVNEIAGATARPESVIGMHFFSPANVMKLLEVVRGAKTSKPVIATAMSVGRRIGKVPVLVGVCHGFVGNRMLHQRGKQAERLILEGALPQQVDKVLYDFGFPMGPFAMGDRAGLDVGWRIRKARGERALIADRLCELGRFGQKTGAGYYRYEGGDRTPIPDPDVEKIILEVSREQSVQRRPISDQEILERLLYPMVNEGAKILEEKLAIRASDIDVIWVYGYGWPVYRGGPMFWADQVGLKAIKTRMLEMQRRHGDVWPPAALLRRLADAGKAFLDAS